MCFPSDRLYTFYFSESDVFHPSVLPTECQNQLVLMFPSLLSCFPLMFDLACSMTLDPLEMLSVLAAALMSCTESQISSAVHLRTSPSPPSLLQSLRSAGMFSTSFNFTASCLGLITGYEEYSAYPYHLMHITCLADIKYVHF